MTHFLKMRFHIVTRPLTFFSVSAGRFSGSQPVLPVSPGGSGCRRGTVPPALSEHSASPQGRRNTILAPVE